MLTNCGVFILRSNLRWRVRSCLASKKSQRFFLSCREIYLGTCLFIIYLHELFVPTKFTYMMNLLFFAGVQFFTHFIFSEMI